jgi:tetratricopeptide (TPR) repeat protein
MKTVLRTPGEHSVCLLAVFAVGMLTVPGCQAPGSQQLRNGRGPYALDRSTASEVAAEQEVAEARRMLRAGEHAQVIPRLTIIATQNPGSGAGTEALYLLGLTYYKIDGLYNAQEYFQKYLAAAPEGAFAPLCREYLRGIDGVKQQRGAARAALEARVAQYDGVSAPEELAANLELAETYWHDGDFEKASAVYAKVLRVWPSLKDDALIRQRMEPAPGGGYIILTPEEVTRRQAAAAPLSVFNVQSFRSGQFRAEHYGYQEEYYNVAGQTVNRGDQLLLDASVTVTIFGIAGQVYDTQTVQLGRLKPGEVRAFSVRFSHFDNIANVHRHECTVAYSQ